MEKIFIKDLKLKAEIETVFAIKYMAVMEAKDGRKYLNVVLADASGDLEARVWHDAEKISANVLKGDFARVKGKLNLFQGRKQFIITDIEKVAKDSVDEGDFVFKAKESPEKMFEELQGIVNGLEDVYIKEMLTQILGDAEIQRRIKLWPAGKTIHHAYRSGLLEHILSCAKLAVDLSPKYGCNTSYVVAGAILHDLCKIYELSDGVSVEYTEEGKLVGHLTKGVEIVDRFAYRVKNFPYQMKLHLKHILLSHHGEYEYGSPKIPQTSEAMLVHLIDFMDSKMATFETIKRTDNNAGDWSGYVKHLDRIVYKNELPTYNEFIKDREDGDKRQQRGPRKSKGNNPELKQSLGKMLEGFKVEE